MSERKRWFWRGRTIKQGPIATWLSRLFWIFLVLLLVLFASMFWAAWQLKDFD